LKKDCSFEEVQRISHSAENFSSWKKFSKNQAKQLIEKEIYAKYGVNV
jgi:hypothetical protein